MGRFYPANKPVFSMGLIVALLVCIGVSLSLGVSLWMRGVRYDQNIGGHLELAANSNQPETAQRELQLALQGMDDAGLTCREPAKEYTSILYNEPAEDVGFWRMNIEQTLTDLEALPDDADHLMVSNTLMKVRESLTDGVKVIAPAGIAKYPHNIWYFIWNVLAILLDGLWIFVLARRTGF